jgi:hypothetical protein
MIYRIRELLGLPSKCFRPVSEAEAIGSHVMSSPDTSSTIPVQDEVVQTVDAAQSKQGGIVGLIKQLGDDK